MSLQERRCMRCMKPIGEGNVCPICGYDAQTPPAENALTPGTLLHGRYTVGVVLRRNGEGVTYMAYDNEIGEPVEIREYNPTALCERAAGHDALTVLAGKEGLYKTLLSDFIDLARTVSKFRTLSHIKQIYELFEQNGTAYYVGEYVDGNATLTDYLRHSEALPWKVVSSLVAPLFNTIGILNASNVIHRGISPDTIYVTKKGEFKLGDFCISAVRAANSELTGEIAESYAAPEQYSVNSWYGAWTDVYSICAVIYRMLTGIQPLDARSRMVNDELTHPRNIVPDVPASVAEGLISGMKLSPDNRIQSMQELSLVLLKSGDPDLQAVSARVQAAEEQKKQKPKSNRYVWITIAVSVAILVIVAIFVILYTLSSDEAEESASLPDFSIPSQSVSSAPPATSSTLRDASYSMPDLRGLEYSKVIISDDYTSLLNIEYKEGYSDEYAKGLIMKQSIKVDAPIAVGEKVTVTVSMGKQHETVPDFTGYSFDEYRAYLDSLGIANRVRLRDQSGPIEGEIVSVSPGIGKELDLSKGDTVLIYLDNTNLDSSDAAVAPDEGQE